MVEAIDSSKVNIDELEGTYECLLYSGQDKNNWHYVTIKKRVKMYEQ